MWTLIISCLALLISGLVAWFGSIRPVKIIGILSGLEFKRWSSLKNGVITNRKIYPLLIIKNVGARNATIELIRLKFYFSKDDCYYAYPGSFNKAKTTEHFIGIVLSSNEVWENYFPFGMKMDEYNKLTDKKGKIELECKLISTKKWKKIKLNVFDFFAVEKFLLPIEKNSAAKSSFVWSNTVQSKEKK